MSFFLSGDFDRVVLDECFLSTGFPHSTYEGGKVVSLRRFPFAAAYQWFPYGFSFLCRFPLTQVDMAAEFAIF